MMLEVRPGKYIAAVSGGVDSMVLLDLLSNLPHVEVVAAHYNHGIRPDGKKDEKLVAAAAKKYGLSFEAGAGKLGPGASEEIARRARYEFLEKMKSKHRAEAIITAHQQDDMIETALINQLRGTGRRGLTAIAANRHISRPLLIYPKSRIIQYAKDNNLAWREDSTNQNEDYLRNYIRLNLMPKMNSTQRQKFLETLDRVSQNNAELDEQLKQLSSKVKTGPDIDRTKFTMLPAELGNELLIYWLRDQGVREFDKKTIGRLNAAIRTAKDRSEHPVKRDLVMRIGHQTAVFERRTLR